MADLELLPPPVADPRRLATPFEADRLASPHGSGALEATIRAAIEELTPTAGWRVEPANGQSPWIHLHRDGNGHPEQGWKLHVSATPGNGLDVLRRCLQVLLPDTADFKVAKSLGFLAALNQGDGGMSQIGKFITMYPANEAHAVALATALDAATRGLRGPAIPSDRPLQPGSLIHYRYGGFNARFLQLPVGEIVPALTSPAGELVADRRLTTYYQPDWVSDPFLAAGVAAAPLTERSPLLAGRFAPLAVLHGSPRGTVFFVLDTADPKPCILKQARGGASVDPHGRDAQDRLRYEAEVLQRLAPDPRFPAFYGLFEDDGNLLLAMEDVAGETLSQSAARMSQEGRLPSGEEVIGWGRDLAGLLDCVHQHGLVYRDLKPTNLIRTNDGHLHLIDVELAHELTSTTPPFGLGTRGYMSPQQTRGDQPAITDDIYALGAMLYLLATGAEPSQAPDPTDLLARPIALLNPRIGQELSAVVARCLDDDSARRFATMRDADAALAAIKAPSLPAPAFGQRLMEEPETAARDRMLDFAHRLGDTLAAVSIPLADGSGRAWQSAHPTASGFLSRDLNTGGAGPLLALAELVDTFSEAGWREVLTASAAWLLRAQRPGGDPLPGLYVGESGIGAALLRAGQVLDDPALISTAADRANWIATMPFGSPDVFNGTAGRIRFHLWLWDATGDAVQLGHAIAAGDQLFAAAEATEDGGVRWGIPEGYGGLSGEYSFGYAHGAAGIADVLLDLFEATDDARFHATARAAAHWLAGRSVPFLPDSSGRAWPNREGQPPFGGFWCHGAGGIGRFYLHAAQHSLMPDAWAMAEGAARAVAAATRWAGPTQCHGLAGNIEFLIDMYQATGDMAYLHEARTMARLLVAFARERNGLLVWPSDSPTVYSPDYTVGYAGVAACLLRLADPAGRPHQLSRRGFQHRHGASTAIG